MPETDRQPPESLELLVPQDTERLRFRPVAASDHAAVLAIYSDPLALKFHPDMDKPAKVQRFIDRQIARYEKFGYGIWLVESLDDGRLIGDAGLTWQETDRGEVLEIGYGLAVDERGKGYATEAALACREFGFAVLGATRLASIIDPDNRASIAVAERIHLHHRLFMHPKLEREYLVYFASANECEIGT